MAIVSIRIREVSTPSKVRWSKVPAAVREKIKSGLATARLTNLRRFSLSYDGEHHQRIGYAMGTSLALHLSLVVLIESGDEFSRFTMQRMSHTEPFHCLI